MSVINFVQYYQTSPMFVGQLIHVTLVVQIVAASNDGADGFAVCPLAVGYLLSLLMTSHARHVELTNNSGSSTSGPTHSSNRPIMVETDTIDENRGIVLDVPTEIKSFSDTKKIVVYKKDGAIQISSIDKDIKEGTLIEL